MADAATLGSISGPGVTIGTPYAMAPEQVKAGKLDHRTDVWALGVLLYEMVAGHQPFGGASLPELMAAILRDRPAPLRLSPAAEPIRGIIETCLAKDPEHTLSARRGREARARGVALGTASPTKSGAHLAASPSSGRLSWSGRRAKARSSVASASAHDSARRGRSPKPAAGSCA